MIWTRRKRALYELRPARNVVLLETGDAEQMQCVSIVGFGAQNALVQLGGVGEFTLAMKRHRFAEPLLCLACHTRSARRAGCWGPRISSSACDPRGTLHARR